MSSHINQPIAFKKVKDLALVNIHNVANNNEAHIKVKGKNYHVSIETDNKIIVNRSSKPNNLFFAFGEFIRHRIFEGTLKSRSIRIQELLNKSSTAITSIEKKQNIDTATLPKNNTNTPLLAGFGALYQIEQTKNQPEITTGNQQLKSNQNTQNNSSLLDSSANDTSLWLDTSSQVDRTQIFLENSLESELSNSTISSINTIDAYTTDDSIDPANDQSLQSSVNDSFSFSSRISETHDSLTNFVPLATSSFKYSDDLNLQESPIDHQQKKSYQLNSFQIIADADHLTLTEIEEAPPSVFNSLDEFEALEAQCTNSHSRIPVYKKTIAYRNIYSDTAKVSRIPRLVISKKSTFTLQSPHTEIQNNLDHEALPSLTPREQLRIITKNRRLINSKQLSNKIAFGSRVSSNSHTINITKARTCGSFVLQAEHEAQAALSGRNTTIEKEKDREALAQEAQKSFATYNKKS